MCFIGVGLLLLLLVFIFYFFKLEGGGGRLGCVCWVELFLFVSLLFGCFRGLVLV